MTTTEQNQAVMKTLSKPAYKSKTFLATLFVESLLLLCFWLVLKFDIEPDLGAKVLSGIVLAMTIVALGYTAPQIAHDIVTRLPLSKGLAGVAGQQSVVAPPDDIPQG
jgi:hypothetical protein